MIMSFESLHNRWLALQVRTGCESRITYGLLERGYVPFLPTYREKKRWSDRTKIVQVPLFPGYVFVRFDVGNNSSIISIPGVLRFVSARNLPLPIDDSEIDSLQITVDSGADCGPVAFLAPGQEVEIRQGALTGVRGTFVRFKNRMRLVVSVKLLMRSVFLELDGLDLTAVSPICALSPL